MSVQRIQHEHHNFKKFIQNLLYKAELSDKYIKLLTDDECMEQFTKAFTHKSVHPDFNYEYYEMLGDGTANHVVVWYMSIRFKDVFDKAGNEGVMGRLGIMTRLKFKGVSKEVFSRFASDLGFREYIRVSEDTVKDSSVLEDTFEAFIGCLDYLINEKILRFSGYGVIYIFMSKLLDKIDIKIEQDKIYDPKSSLNNEIGKFGGKIKVDYRSIDNTKGNPSFLNDTSNVPKRFKSEVVIFNTHTGEELYRSKPGFGATKKIAETMAAKHINESGKLDELKLKF